MQYTIIYLNPLSIYSNWCNPGDLKYSNKNWIYFHLYFIFFVLLLCIVHHHVSLSFLFKHPTFILQSSFRLILQTLDFLQPTTSPSLFFGGSFSLVKKNNQPQKGQRSQFFYREKNRAISRLAGFPITKDLMIEDWSVFFWVRRTKNHRNFRLYAFNFFLNRPWWVMKKKRPRYTQGETRFIRQNWPILGQCSLNLLLLEHLCQ